MNYAAPSPRRCRTSRFRPRVEALEDRCLLANQLFTVPGPAGVTSTFRFDWTVRDAAFNNEIGVYAVNDSSGRVGRFAPGDAGYLNAVLHSSTRQVLFDSSTGAGNFPTL